MKCTKRFFVAQSGEKSAIFGEKGAVLAKKTDFFANQNSSQKASKKALFADKIALFGGSFDPPHLAHLEMIKWLSAHFAKVIIIPAYQNPLKNFALIPLEIRIKWCKKMCQNIEADFQNIIVSDIESRANRTLFAYEIAAHFSSEFFGTPRTKSTPHSQSTKNTPKSSAQKSSQKDFAPPLCLAIGEDCLSEIHKWKNIKELAKIVDFVVFQRNVLDSANSANSAKSNNANDFASDFANTDFIKSSDFLRAIFVDFIPNAKLQNTLPFLPNGNLSSTFLRHSLQKSFMQNPRTNSPQSIKQSQLIKAIPQCLRDDVVEFFAKTSLQCR